MLGVGIERLEVSVVEDEKLGQDQASQQSSVPSIGSGKGQVSEQLGVTLPFAQN